MLILLSGPIGVGKTSLCLRLVDAARLRGLGVFGALTPAVMQEGVKVGIQAVDLGTGEMRPMARVVQQDDEFKGTRVGPYAFDDRTLDWVVALCTQALADAETVPGSLIFVDEIGKLELSRGEGLAPLIPLLAQPRDARVVVIVRDFLLDRLLSRVQGSAPRVVVLDAQCRQRAWDEITSLLFGEEAGL